ncbi:MAG: hypothetical protein K5912_00665 [Alphaproteobacteria bacterium]|nr:hypothetical protein [Alphaproteobacteria bacterium]
MTKQELKAKIRKFLAGIGIITASYVGGHKTANAQEFSDMTDEEKIEYVLNMTDEQKQSRLTELSVSLDSIGKIIEERDSLCKQIRAFIEEKFPFDVYSNIDWKLPVAGYIKKDVLKQINDAPEHIKDTVILGQFENETDLINYFFNSNNDIDGIRDVGVSFVTDILMGRIRQMVDKGSLTPQQGKYVSSKLNPYLKITKVPAASKYEIMRSELLKFYNQDVLKLRTSYNNGDIGPEEYTRQSQKYDKFFDVLLKTLDGANKNGALSGAGTIYLASRCLVHRAESILRYKYSKKRMFEEERNAILNPPVLPKQVVKKSRSH